MDNPVVLKMALANTGYGIEEAEEVYDFIETNSKNIETYQLDANRVTVAAIDYVIILGSLGSVASIAALLWMAYEKFIAPKKRKKEDTSGIYIHIDSEEGNPLEFWLGNEFKEKDLFIECFTKKVTEFADMKRTQEIYTKTKIELESSGRWIHRKHRES